MKRQVLLVFCLGISAAAICEDRTAMAAITFSGETVEGGTGFGNVYDTLGLHNTPTEFGAVIWNGTMDVKSGNAINQSQTYLVSNLISGINPKPGLGSNYDDWGLILNLAQSPGQGSELTIKNFDLIVFDLSGMEKGRLSYIPIGGSTVLDPDGQGTGSSGFLFRLSGLGALVTLAGGPTMARLGMEVTEANAFTNANGGNDNFYLGNFPRVHAVPEPASMVAWGLGLIMVGAVRLRRTRTLV